MAEPQPYEFAKTLVSVRTDKSEPLVNHLYKPISQQAFIRSDLTGELRVRNRCLIENINLYRANLEDAIVCSKSNHGLETT